jgi:hypothetical protein
MPSNLQQLALKNLQSETVRIISLPSPDPLTPEDVALVARHYCPAGTFVLNKEQAEAMVAYHRYGGLVAPVPVGYGKTLISALIVSDAYSVFGKRRIVLSCPPNLVHQFKNVELPKYRKHFSINVPFYYLSELSREKRVKAAKSGRPGCYVVPYSLMSTEFGGQILDAIQPQVIVGDEIQNVATYHTSGRGRVFKTIVDKYHPQLIGLSGTITKKRILDYHFLVTRALGENSFVPIPVVKAEEWSQLLDCNAESSYSDLKMLDPLIQWAGEERTLVGARKAFRKRMGTTPGVVPVEEKALGTSLRIVNHSLSQSDIESSDGYDELQRLLHQLNTQWLTPNGDEIDNALNTWMWRYWLEGFGFYYSRTWPTLEELAGRRGITLCEASILLENSQLAHERQQEYHRTLRRWLKYRGRVGLHTPMLVGQNMHLYGDRDVGQDLYSAWRLWKDSLEVDVIERDSEAVRVCDFRVRQTVAWMAEQKEPGGLVWYYNDEVGRWILEAAKAAGLPVVYCPSGKRYNKIIEDQSNRDKWSIASIQAHHAGHNLQYHYWRSFYAQWPREAYLAEQSIGRTHRQGQPEDTVEVHTSIGTQFDRVLYSACLNDAAYAHQTTANRQKIIYADYDEPPRIVPHSVLVEWGADPRGQADLRNFFG